MRTKNFAIFVTLGSLILTSCTMFQKKSETPVASTSPTGEVIPASVPPEILSKYTKGWPDSSVAGAKEILTKYGEPTESTANMLVWSNIQPYKRITVFREEINHKFPLLHKDVVEHTVSFKIPSDKADDLTKFDGSVTFDRTRGELSARSNGEPMNILALNLASDIIAGKRDYTSARTELGKAAFDYLNGNKTVLSQNLQFVGQLNTADQDQNTKVNWAQSQESHGKAQPGKQGLIKQAQEQEIAE